MDANVTEGCAHYNGLVAMLLVVIEDALDRLNTRVIVTFVVLASCLLVPVEDLVKVMLLRNMTEGYDALVRRMVKSESRQPLHRQQLGQSQKEG